MNLSKQIYKNVFYSWAYFALSILISFFLMPFLVGHLGDSSYGVWTLILSLTGYMGIFDLGIRTSVVKHLAEVYAKNDRDEFNRLASTSFFMYCAIGIVVVIIACIISTFFNTFFKISPSQLTDAKLVILIVGVDLAISFPSAVFGGILWGLQRHDIVSSIEAFALICKTTLIVLFIQLGHGIVALACISLCIKLIAQMVRFFFARYLIPSLRIHATLFKFQTLKKIVKYSFLVFLLTLAGQIIFSTDNIVIGLFISTSSITYYAIALRLIDYTRQSLRVMTSVLMPTASSLSANNDLEKIQKILLRGTKYSLLLILPIGTFFVLFGQNLITLWMGSKYQSSTIILIILIIPYLISVSENVAGVILQGIGKLHFLTILTFSEALLNLILSIILIKPLGLVGVAVGTAIPFTISRGIIMPIYICRLLRQPMLLYIKKAVIPPMVSVLPFVFLIMIEKTIIYPKTFLILGLQFFIAIIVYGLVSVKFCFSRPELRSLLETFTKTIRKPVPVQ